MKKRVSLGIVIIASSALVSLYVYHERHRPKRVWVTYSEKYQSQNYEKAMGEKLFAEERLGWRIAGNSGCMVLTHNRRNADYIVSISVIRFPAADIVSPFGSATLSIAKRNGDVVLVDSFYQDRKSGEDIAQQPITKTWDALCKKKSH